MSSVDGRHGTSVTSDTRIASVVAAVSTPAVSITVSVKPLCARPVTAAAKRSGATRSTGRSSAFRRSPHARSEP